MVKGLETHLKNFNTSLALFIGSERITWCEYNNVTGYSILMHVHITIKIRGRGH